MQSAEYRRHISPPAQEQTKPSPLQQECYTCPTSPGRSAEKRPREDLSMSKLHAILWRRCTHTKEHFEPARHTGVPAVHRSKTSGPYWQTPDKTSNQRGCDVTFLMLMLLTLLLLMMMLLMLLLMLPYALKRPCEQILLLIT